MQQLSDQVAVVTGGARGIGRGIAAVLAAEGARLVIVDLDGKSAERTAAELDGLGIAADVVDRASLDAMAVRVVDELGRIDIVAANAGIYPVAELTEMTDEMWARVMDVNVGGAVRTVQACLPTMLAAWLRAHRLDVVDHRSDNRSERLRTLRRVEGGDARLHALRRRRARSQRDHGERRHARKRRHRRASPVRATSTSSGC